MNRVIYLKKGEPYFYAAYFPEKPYHPSIETLVYDGESLAEWVLEPADFSKPREEIEYVAL
ncbi:MAG: hypothetical protein VYA55_06945 [Pseudomonadota bacterium]|nr:hypothetical protein [Pseudomonadota bacterium]